MTKQKNALLSVYDKTGIVEFARNLHELNWNIYSSGGTAKALSDAGIPVTDVATLVGGSAILGHRVVTLSREIHAGLLARYIQEDQKEMEELGLPYIDLVCFNLYPLAEEIAKSDSTQESVIEKTDIGGPAALNSGAKGYRIVIGDPADYEPVIKWLQDDQPDKEAFVKDLAAKAYFTTSKYYLPAAKYHSDAKYEGMLGERVENLKYGESPYLTPAAHYKVGDDTDTLALHNFELVEGDARSFIGLTDADCLLQGLTHIAAGFEQNFGKVPLMAMGVKHGNACGAAVGDDPITVIKQMIAGDKRALFGGVIMTNFPITRAVAQAMTELEPGDPPRLFDGVFAPAFDAEVPEILQRKQGKCRMMANPALASLTIDSLDHTTRRRQIRGGYLTQPNYTFVLDITRSDVHGEPLSDKENQDLIMAWAIGCISNSNTITLVRDGQLIGNGVGQQDRVGAAELAIKRARDAGHDVKGSVAWSDSFFPAPDGPEVLGKAGVRAIFSSSGSKRDQETIDMCAKIGVTLLMQPDSEVRGFAKH
jgi:phosphoribosylaminoimidazolecarboxamide formyltransferase/IMP cyclohydrolase